MSTLPCRLPNPFLSSIVEDPWKQTGVSVPTIHQVVFDACCGIVDYVRAGGHGAGILVHGQPGSGKTHLLARLREHLAQGMTHPDLSHPRQVFVWVRLATSPQHIWRHVRERLVDDLLRRQPNGLTQLEILMAARFARDEHAEGDLVQWWEYFRDEHPARFESHLENWAMENGVGKTFLRVLLHLVRGTHRFTARAWLRGESLPDSDLKLLGLPEPREEEDPAQPELEARHVVLWMCHLAGTGLPIVFCFDQVEALQQTPGDLQGLYQFGRLASDLHDETSNAAMISCVQSDFLFPLVETISGYAKDRILSFSEEVLTPLTKSEAADLIAARLDAPSQLQAVRPKQPDRLWPFSQKDIDSAIGDAGCTARELISKFSNKFRQLQGAPITITPIEQFLPEIWESRLEKAIQTNGPEQSEHILADGLPMLIDTMAEGWKISTDDRYRDVDFVVTGPNAEAKVGISFCTDQSMNGLAPRLKRLQDQHKKGVQANDFHKFVLIRDHRTPLSKTARKVHERLDEFEKAGAVFYRPSLEAMAALDALRQLLADADSGDLSINGQTVSPKTVQGWLADHLVSALAEMRDALIGYPNPLAMDHPDSQLDELIELLNAEHVLAIEEAAVRLQWPADRVELLARDNPHQVGLLQGPPPVLFQPVAAGVAE